MTTNSELLDQAMSRLGQRASTRVRADVLAEINTTIDRLERNPFLPWFLEKDATLSVVANDTSVALPSDFLREAEESRPYYVLDSKVHYLTKRLFAALPGEDDATSVKFYAIRGETFYFRMAADQSYTITLSYYAAQTGNLVDDASTVSNLWLTKAHDWVVNEALTKVAAFHVQNEKLAILLKGDASAARKELYGYHEARINENQDFVVGGSTNES